MAIERQFELNEQLLECRSKVAQMAVELKEARSEVAQLRALVAEAREEGIEEAYRAGYEEAAGAPEELGNCLYEWLKEKGG